MKTGAELSSRFENRPNNFYATPEEALAPLIPHLPSQAHYIEPCVGDYDLVRAMEKLAPDVRCIGSSDFYPQHAHTPGEDATAAVFFFPSYLDDQKKFIITNPPHDRHVVGPLIKNCRWQARTWLLIPADWLMQVWFADHMCFCGLVIPIGRVSWMGNKVNSTKSYCWARFEKLKVFETVITPRRKL